MMISRAKIFIVWVLIAGPGLNQAVSAQPVDTVWQPIVEQDGVRLLYLFYAEADASNNGVVVRLINTNDWVVQYRFRVVFRTASGEEAEREVGGKLDTRQQKTGDLDGLFWIPFTDGRSVAELGIRGLKIERLSASDEGLS